jgi:hypothetical protein
VSSPGTTRVEAWLLGLCAAAAAGAQALRIIADPDLWWHLRTGQWILEHRQIPAVDLFSFTAAGAPWTNHEWLTELILAIAFNLGGGAALTTLRAALLIASAGILAWLLYRRTGAPLLAGLLVAVYVPLFAPFWNVRAQTFSYFLTLAVLAILEVTPRRPGAAWILPPLLALWVNLHGGFLLGLLTAGLGVLALGTGVEAPLRGRPAAPPRRTWALLGLMAAAPLLNPQGWRLAPYLLRELSANHATVTEWRSLTEVPTLWPKFLILVLPPLAVLLAAPARARLTETALFLASVFLAYRHIRFLAVLAIFSALVLGTGLGRWIEGRRATGGERFWLTGTPALAVFTIALLLWSAPRLGSAWQRKGLALEVARWSAPVLAARFLSEHDLGPNLLTRLDWGGYVIYHLWPRYRVSVDGRNMTVYSPAFVAEQLAAYDQGDPLRGLRGLRVDAALVESSGPGFDGMTREPGWRMVFRDPLSAVFVPEAAARRLASGPPPIGEYRFDEAVPTFP